MTDARVRSWPRRVLWRRLALGAAGTVIGTAVGCVFVTVADSTTALEPTAAGGLWLGVAITAALLTLEQTTG